MGPWCWPPGTQEGAPEPIWKVGFGGGAWPSLARKANWPLQPGVDQHQMGPRGSGKPSLLWVTRGNGGNGHKSEGNVLRGAQRWDRLQAALAQEAGPWGALPAWGPQPSPSGPFLPLGLPCDQLSHAPADAHTPEAVERETGGQEQGRGGVPGVSPWDSAQPPDPLLRLLHCDQGRKPKASEGFSTQGLASLTSEAGQWLQGRSAPGFQILWLEDLKILQSSECQRHAGAPHCRPRQPGLRPSRPRAQMAQHLLSCPSTWRGGQRPVTAPPQPRLSSSYGAGKGGVSGVQGQERDPPSPSAK